MNWTINKGRELENDGENTPLLTTKEAMFLPRAFLGLIFLCITGGLVLWGYLFWHTAVLSANFLLLVGVINSVIGSVLSASGYICQKWAHLKIAHRENKKITQQTEFVLGLILLAIGTISAVVNLGILGQSVQAPFAALTLISNAIFATIVLHENFTRYDFLSSFLIIAGVAIAVFGITSTRDTTIKHYAVVDLLQLFFFDSPWPLFYIVVVIMLLALLLRIVKFYSLQSTSLGLFTYGLTAGLVAGFTSLSVKSVVEIMKTAATGKSKYNDLANPITYVFIVLIPCALYPQLFYMNKGLSYFGALKYVPVYQSFIILGNLLSGVIFFGEINEFNPDAKVIFLCGCVVTICGVWSLVAKHSSGYKNTVHHLPTIDNVDPPILLDTKFDTDTIDWISDNVVVCKDFDECKRLIVELFKESKHSIYYSTFLCSFEHKFKVCSTDEETSVLELISCACNRGVKVHILYNSITDYGTCSLDKLLMLLPNEVDVKVCVSDLGPSQLTKHFSSNSKYAFHHQKYLCVDEERIMITGCDVNEERNGWLQKNGKGYYWHELSVVAHMSMNMISWVKNNHALGVRSNRVNSPPLFPIVNGGWDEENIMVDMILKAKKSIHLENQIFITGVQGVQENRIAYAIVERIRRAVVLKENFLVLILTNGAQKDEPSFLTRMYCTLSLQWSMLSIEKLAGKQNISKNELYDHLVFAKLQHNETLIKVHSNILIVDGDRCLRSSSNLADRSLSRLPCDTETGLLFQGLSVNSLQQSLFNMYCNTETEYFAFDEFFRIVQENGQTNLRKLFPSKISFVVANALMSLFVMSSEGATGGRFEVHYTVSSV